MTALAAAIFWSCALLLVYAHLGYPIAIWAWARRAEKPVRRGPGLPSVSVIVVAHDEEAAIAARIEDLLAQDYPRVLVSIAIASDGSTDATAARARAFASPDLQLFEFAAQRGKPACLNDVIPRMRSELIVLADARQRFDAQALRALVAPFEDTAVGAVSGELVLEAQPGGVRGGGWYWAYEKFLRKHESRVDSTVGATGAIYAIRRELFEPLPEDTVLDDMLIPCRIARRDFRVLFEPLAKAFDHPAPPDAELRRKARTLAGNFQLFSRERWLLDPRANRLWIQTVSHKLLRLACPLFLLGALASNAWLALLAGPRGVYRAALAGQLLFYAAALAGDLLARRGKRPRLLAAAHLFCLLHWATVLGFVRFARGEATAKWKGAPVHPRRRRAPDPHHLA